MLVIKSLAYIYEANIDCRLIIMMKRKLMMSGPGITAVVGSVPASSGLPVCRAWQNSTRSCTCKEKFKGAHRMHALFSRGVHHTVFIIIPHVNCVWL